MILTAEDLFLQGPYLLLTARKTCQETQTWALLCKHCIFPNFETLPLHFIPRHPSPTQHLPRYLRVTSFPFVSCRSLISSLHTPLSSFSWDHSSPGLPTQSRRHHVPSLHRGHGHSATPITSLGSGRHGSRGKTSSCAARLLAHRAPSTGPALARRIPPGSGAYHRPTPFRDRSRPGAMLGSCRLGLP
jgi:hypothetical protein